MINVKNIQGFNKLSTITLKEPVPQVGSFVLQYSVVDDNILLEKEGEWLYLVINNHGDFIIGRCLYKMSNKSETLKFAGRLKILNGKIVDIDGD
jgi:hypothetical protein